METEKSLFSMNRSVTDLFGMPEQNHTAAAIGAFDGLHRGHQHILTETVRYAREHALTAAAILFDPLPSQFFGRIGPNDRILLRDEQEQKLYELGIDRVIFLPFTEQVMNLSAREFLASMQTVLHTERLFMGADFCLGKKREGTPEVLTALGKEFGFSVKIIEKDTMDGGVISSTRIRSLLHEGKISSADRLLGYPFFFSGKIIHGEARGRKLGFPTLNIKIPEGKLILPNGVYAVMVTLDGSTHPSVTNIGVRPTFGLEALGIVVESYMLDTSGNFYGDTATLEFIEMLRPERRFDSADALKEQVSKDISKTKEILK